MIFRFDFKRGFPFYSSVLLPVASIENRVALVAKSLFVLIYEKHWF